MRTKEKDEAVAKTYSKNECLRNMTYVGEVEGKSVYKFEVRNRHGFFPSEHPRYTLVWCSDDMEIRPAMGSFLTLCEEKLGISTFY